jgi:hypothetical protein
MTRRPWISKKLAERRRKEYRLHLAGYTQEEIADKVGGIAPSFAAISSGSAIQSAPGDPPTFRRRTMSRWQESTSWSMPMAPN